MRHLLLKATTVEQKKQSQKEDERINAQEMFSLYEEILREMIVFLPNLVVISYTSEEQFTPLSMFLTRVLSSVFYLS